MNDSARAFRDYATRISFNLNLSRNQVSYLAGVVSQVEGYRDGMSFDEKSKLDTYDQDCRLLGLPHHFVHAHRSLSGYGLVQSTAGWLADCARVDALKAKGKRAIREFNGPTVEPTEAGWHVVSLLRIAALIPQAAVNNNKRRAKRAA